MFGSSRSSSRFRGVTAIGNQVVLSDAMGSIRAFNSANGQATWSWDWGRETIVPATAGQNGLLVRSTDESVALIDFKAILFGSAKALPHV